jgi:hypothetical protein
VLVVVRDRGSGPSDLAGTYRCRTVIGKTDSIQLTFSAGTGGSAAALEEPAAQGGSRPADDVPAAALAAAGDAHRGGNSQGLGVGHDVLGRGGRPTGSVAR